LDITGKIAFPEVLGGKDLRCWTVQIDIWIDVDRRSSSGVEDEGASAFGGA
jgi:hypothetical protein